MGQYLSEDAQNDEEVDQNLNLEENVLKSPLVLNFDTSFAFNVKDDDITDYSKFKNYGKLPVMTINNILLFHQPMDLMNLFSSCKLFYEVSNRNPFWKDYYYNYYIEEEPKDMTKELNFKKLFFKRFREDELEERRFLRKFKVQVKQIKQKSMRIRYGIVLVGADGPYTSTYYDRFHKQYNQKGNRDTPKFYFRILDRYDRKFELNRRANNFVMKYSSTGKNLGKLPFKEAKNIGYLLCFDFNNRSTFTSSLPNLLKNLKKSEKKLMDEDLKSNRRHNIVLLALGCDLSVDSDDSDDDKRRVVTKEELANFVKQNNLKGYVECSAERECNLYSPIGILYDRIRRDFLKRSSSSKKEEEEEEGEENEIISDSESSDDGEIYRVNRRNWERSQRKARKIKRRKPRRKAKK